MNADPCEQFVGGNVRRVRIGFNCRDDFQIVSVRPAGQLSGCGVRLEREQAKHLDPMPGYWRAAGDVVSDGAGATTENRGDAWDGHTAG